jgi:hypothetical protein
MQTLHVVPFSSGDYIHPDETVRVTHDTTRQSMDVFIKDLDAEGTKEGRTALIIPLNLLEDLIVGEKDAILVLSPSAKADLQERLAQLRKFRKQDA